MQIIYSLLTSINNLSNNLSAAFRLPNIYLDDVQHIETFYSVTADYTDGILSIKDQARPEDAQLQYQGFMVSSFKDYKENVDIFFMDGSSLTLMAYPL